jgi:ABC-2 type transport system ATP-binding protein
VGAALVIEQLSKRYAGPPVVDAVRGIDLEVSEGEIFGLLGPNGSLCKSSIRAPRAPAFV